MDVSLLDVTDFLLGAMKNIPDVKTMKAELTHIGVEIPATATFLEIFELHENLVLDKGIDLFEEDIKNVKFPCLPVSSRFQSYTATQT